MVFGMAVTGSAGVYAGTNLQKISAYLNHSIGFQVNGADYTPQTVMAKHWLLLLIIIRLTCLYVRWRMC